MLRLFTSAIGQLALDRVANLLKPLGQAVSDLLPEVSLGAFEA